MSEFNPIKKLADTKAKILVNNEARQLLNQLFDQETFVEILAFSKSEDELAGVVCGYGVVKGAPTYAFSQYGSIDTMHVKKILHLYDLALKTGAPVVGVYDSTGLRVSQGADALWASGELISKIHNMSGVVPQISVVVGSCVGINSMIACSADFVIMSSTAELLANPANSDARSGTSIDAASQGVAHIVAPDSEKAIMSARKLLTMLPLNNLAPLPISQFSETVDSAKVLVSACENIQTAESENIVAAIADEGSVVPFFLDFGEGVYTALTTLGGYPCGMVITKGGKISSDDCNKIARVVSVLDSYQVPVVTLLNSTGIEVAKTSGSRDIAKLSHIYAEATTPKVSVIIGNAYGSAYVALAGNSSSADSVFAWPNAVITALSPETAVAFQLGDKIKTDRSRDDLILEYTQNQASPFALAEKGYLDDIIDPADTRHALLSVLDILSAKRVSRLNKKHGNIPF